MNTKAFLYGLAIVILVIALGFHIILMGTTSLRTRKFLLWALVLMHFSIIPLYIYICILEVLFWRQLMNVVIVVLISINVLLDLMRLKNLNNSNQKEVK